MTADIGPLLDELRPWLADMIAQSVRTAVGRTEVPTLLPATVVSIDETTRLATVTPDGPTGGADIPAVPLVGLPPAGARVMLLFQPPSGVFIVGYVGEMYAALNARTTVLNPTALRTIDGGLANADWPGGADGACTVTFNKRLQSTSLKVHLDVSAYATTTNNVACDFYVDIDGTDFLVINGFFNALNDHRFFTGTLDIAGLAAGQRVCKVQATIGGAATPALNGDANDTCALTVTEVLPV